MRERINGIKRDLARNGQEATVVGWVRTCREQKNFSFVEINDGSSLSNLQIVIDDTISGYASILPKLTTGSSIRVKGILVEGPKKEGKPQELELKATEVTVVGESPADSYPLQKKRHTFEFLRSIAHLRPRTNTLGAVQRVRNELAFSTHRFFQQKGFTWVHTPIITASDCEGAGQMFHVTTLDLEKLPKTQEGKVDYSTDFFAKPAFLTVSGQLNGEIYASAMKDIYTFGPTFRAENSNTSRHLAEFWMIEPEIAFATLDDDMDLAESYLKFIFKSLLENCTEDMAFFDRQIMPGTIDRLRQIVDTPFERVSYTFAVRILEKSGKTFEFPVKWGLDLQSEHERYLTEEYFGRPVILTDYPKEIKAFYMRENADGKTVAAMDVLVPKVGEIIGGSQREERLDVLEKRLDALRLDKEAYWWYLELRKYGSVPHAGFGAGFERLVQFATGMENIRDVIPFPRVPGKAEF